jgi:general stress protein 26
VRPGFRTAALVLVLGLAAGAFAQEKPAAARARILEIARKIMVAARYCTLATTSESGEPQARIVDPLEPDEGFAVYVATNPLSRKVAEIRRDPRVTLLYFDRARSAYVTLVGRAAEVTGVEKTRRRKPEWQQFFPAEKPDNYLLYRITPVRAEVVSAADGLGGDPVTWKPEIVEFKP